jgi:hypothetical protein
MKTARILLAVAVACAPPAASAAEPPADPIAIGSRRELFVDDHLIERLSGRAEQRLQHPQPQDLAITHDAPWEGAGSGYHSVFHDPDVAEGVFRYPGRYRMYYRGSPLDIVGGKLRSEANRSFLCYAESDDGIHWRKPELGLHEFQGSKANNIVLVPNQFGDLKADPGHVAVFRDDNPSAPADAKYKAIIRSGGKRGLYAFQSPDGLHWKPMSDKPVITAGAFDSQNLAFWDPTRGVYRAYWRYFTEGVINDEVWKPAGHRAIRTATSPDLLTWSEQSDLTYVDSPSEQLYTNQVKPYHRAPHLLIGLPVRYVDRGWSDSMRALPEREHRELRSQANPRYGTAVTEGLLMASRDGVRFRRWNEAFLRPGIEREGTWQYGQQFVAWHLVETKSALPGAPNELSLYAGESSWTGGSSALRRYTLRLDGFVAVHAPPAGGTLVTKPFTFTGGKLSLNMATSAAGTIRVEVQTAAGEPIAGHTLDECSEIFGDTIDRTVTWKGGADVGKLAGRPVRMLVELRDADLYSFKFE